MGSGEIRGMFSPEQSQFQNGANEAIFGVSIWREQSQFWSEHLARAKPIHDARIEQFRGMLARKARKTRATRAARTALGESSRRPRPLAPPEVCRRLGSFCANEANRVAPNEAKSEDEELRERLHESRVAVSENVGSSKATILH